MKKFIGIVAAGILTAALMHCSQDNPASTDLNTDQGTVGITMNLSKVGATRSLTDLELTKLCLSLSNGGTPITDTINLTGNSNIIIPHFYRALDVDDQWILNSHTIDNNGVTIHKSVDTFAITAGDTTNVDITMGAQYSLLRTNFFPIKDSVTKCEIMLNGAVIEDSSFAKQTRIGDTILLGHNYIPATVLGSDHQLQLTAYGVWGTDDTIPLYRGDTIITAVSGNDTNYVVPLNWVGPDKEVGHGNMAVTLGKIGTVWVNGKLIDKVTDTIPGMVVIPAKDSSFLMGQTGVTNTVQSVTFTYDFHMKRTEVTRKEFSDLMKATYPEYIKDPFSSSVYGSDNVAADNITWYNAVLYCNALSVAEGREPVYSYDNATWANGYWCTLLTNLTIDYSKNGYRLPTEAEWEYACRAGSTTNYFWGEAVNGDYMWYAGNVISLPNTQVVATKLPNQFGLYDMLGNVYEWVNDEFAEYDGLAKTDPTGPAGHDRKLIRGGYYNSGIDGTVVNNYCAFRTHFPAESRMSTTGLRVVLPIQ